MERKANRVQIIGEGGREHAFAWKFLQDDPRTKIIFADPSRTDQALDSAIKNRVNLTVVGPELSLSLGIVDLFTEKKLRIVGPKKEGAKLETDKIFAEEFMTEFGIPHPKSKSFIRRDEASHFIQNQNPDSYVIKDPGPASGKGVFEPKTNEEAQESLRIIFEGKVSGDRRVLIQEKVEGREVSLITLFDGETIISLLPAQDYKKLHDGDLGPNTGGMGAIAPAKLEGSDYARIWDQIVIPTVKGIKKRELYYKGFLYFGIILTKDGPLLLEYNARSGDPETQVVMPLLKSNLKRLLDSTFDGTLKNRRVDFYDGYALGTVLTSEGYPDSPITEREIKGIENVRPGVIIFNSAVRRENNKTYTKGGRVLTIVSRGSSIDEARSKIDSSIGPSGINFEGMQYRKDIGK